MKDLCWAKSTPTDMGCYSAISSYDITTQAGLDEFLIGTSDFNTYGRTRWYDPIINKDKDACKISAFTEWVKFGKTESYCNNYSTMAIPTTDEIMTSVNSCRADVFSDSVNKCKLACFDDNGNSVECIESTIDPCVEATISDECDPLSCTWEMESEEYIVEG